MKSELRTLLARVAFRVEEREDKKPKIVGHAAVFDQLSVPLWGFREKIAPGAFSKTIREADVHALFNHDRNLVLGRNKADTLRLQEDNVGLAIEIDPPDTQVARDLMISMDRGDIDKMSFAFYPIRTTWEVVNEDSDEEELIATRTEVKLEDVSVVTKPAYEGTDASVVRGLTGFDYPALARAAAKAQNGLRLRKSEQEMLHDYRTALKQLEVAPGQMAHPVASEETPLPEERQAPGEDAAPPAFVDSGAPLRRLRLLAAQFA